MGGGRIEVDALPKRLSPSSLKSYMQCPKLFHFRYVLGIRTPPTAATLRGNLAHTAFERVFDHEPGDRSPDVALAYADAALDLVIDPDARATLTPAHVRLSELAAAGRPRAAEAAEADRRIVEEEGEDAFRTGLRRVVSGWYGMEDPSKFTPTDRELYISARAAGVDLHGFIDRVDRIPDRAGVERVYVSDYKTGKLPSQRFVDEAFFQLEVYAVVLGRMGVAVDRLRLVHTAVAAPEGVLTRVVDQAVLTRTEQKLRSVHRGMLESARTGEWATRRQPLCDWCHFKPVCPEFEPQLEGLLPEEVESRL